MKKHILNISIALALLSTSNCFAEQGQTSVGASTVSSQMQSSLSKDISLAESTLGSLQKQRDAIDTTITQLQRTLDLTSPGSEHASPKIYAATQSAIAKEQSNLQAIVEQISDLEDSISTHSSELTFLGKIAAQVALSERVLTAAKKQASTFRGDWLSIIDKQRQISEGKDPAVEEDINNVWADINKGILNRTTRGIPDEFKSGLNEINQLQRAMESASDNYQANLTLFEKQYGSYDKIPEHILETVLDPLKAKMNSLSDEIHTKTSDFKQYVTQTMRNNAVRALDESKSNVLGQLNSAEDTERQAQAKLTADSQRQQDIIALVAAADKIEPIEISNKSAVIESSTLSLMDAANDFQEGYEELIQKYIALEQEKFDSTSLTDTSYDARVQTFEELRAKAQQLQQLQQQFDNPGEIGFKEKVGNWLKKFGMSLLNFSLTKGFSISASEQAAIQEKVKNLIQNANSIFEATNLSTDDIQNYEQVSTQLEKAESHYSQEQESLQLKLVSEKEVLENALAEGEMALTTAQQESWYKKLFLPATYGDGEPGDEINDVIDKVKSDFTTAQDAYAKSYQDLVKTAAQKTAWEDYVNAREQNGKYSQAAETAFTKLQTAFGDKAASAITLQTHYNKLKTLQSDIYSLQQIESLSQLREGIDNIGKMQSAVAQKGVIDANTFTTSGDEPVYGISEDLMTDINAYNSARQDFAQLTGETVSTHTNPNPVRIPTTPIEPIDHIRPYEPPTPIEIPIEPPPPEDE